MTESEKNAKKFTAKYIRGLSCPEHMRQYYAVVLPDVHLYVSIGRSGNKNFIFRCMHDGNWRTLDLRDWSANRA